jgi:hypothetical protein
VLVSAALSRLGNPAKIVEAARVGRFILVTSPTLLAELDDVLSRPKIAMRLDPEGLQRLREVLAAAPVTGDPPAVALTAIPRTTTSSPWPNALGRSASSRVTRT